MKKLLTLIAFVLVTFTVDAQSTQKGDINGDGDISVNDVAMIVNYILGITDSNFIIANADVNGDGEIDINDVMSTVSTILEGNGGNGSGIGDTSQAYLTCPDENHPHIIDLGLPSGTKWACCNVGANTPEEYGGYYAWGETEEKSIYTEVSYLYSSGVDKDGDGWYDDFHYDTEIYGVWQNLGSDIAGTQYDVAHVKWGGNWQMPSWDQIKELYEYCTEQSTTVNGVNGDKLTSKTNGGSIFFPMAGYRWIDGRDGRDTDCSDGNYWSSTQDSSEPDFAYALGFVSGDVYFDANGFSNGPRHLGLSVRPVWVP